MRNRKPVNTNLAECEIIFRLPISFESLNEEGSLGWKAGNYCISSPFKEKKTTMFIEEALKPFPKNIHPANGEIIVKIPLSYESLGSGRLGWKVGHTVISSPADRQTTITFIRKKLTL